jgi:hypothetical protein
MDRSTEISAGGEADVLTKSGHLPRHAGGQTDDGNRMERGRAGVDDGRSVGARISSGY